MGVLMVIIKFSKTALTKLWCQNYHTRHSVAIAIDECPSIPQAYYHEWN